MAYSYKDVQLLEPQAMETSTYLLGLDADKIVRLYDNSGAANIVSRIAAVEAQFSNYVTLDGAQTITGAKTFSALLTANGGVKIGESTLTELSQGTLDINTNVIYANDIIARDISGRRLSLGYGGYPTGYDREIFMQYHNSREARIRARSQNGIDAWISFDETEIELRTGDGNTISLDDTGLYILSHQLANSDGDLFAADLHASGVYTTDLHAEDTISGNVLYAQTLYLGPSEVPLYESSGALATKSGAVLLTSANWNSYISVSGHLPLTGGTLTGTLVSQAVLPSADNTYALGSSTRRWSLLYTLGASFGGNVTIGAPVTTSSTSAYLIITPLSLGLGSTWRAHSTGSTLAVETQLTKNGFELNFGTTLLLRTDGASYLGNEILTSANWPSYISSLSARYLVCEDTRDVTDSPTGLTDAVRADFKTQSVLGLSEGTFAGVLSMRFYGSGTDYTGGRAHQLAFGKDSGIYHRTGDATGWYAWSQVAEEGRNVSFNSVTSASYFYANNGYNIVGTDNAACGLMSCRTITSGYDAKDIWLYNTAAIRFRGTEFYFTTGFVTIGQATSLGYRLGVAGDAYINGTIFTKDVRFIGTSSDVTTNDTYLSLGSNGNEICVSGMSDTTLYVNYRKSHQGYAPLNWRFMAGSATAYANIYAGTFYGQAASISGNLYLGGGSVYLRYNSSTKMVELNGATMAVTGGTTIDMSSYVTVDTQQFISGIKYFDGHVYLNGLVSFDDDVYHSSGDLHLIGCRLIIAHDESAGGLNMPTYFIPTIDGLQIDSQDSIKVTASGQDGYGMVVSQALSCKSLTQTSDMRLKDKVADLTLTTGEMAAAPLFRFRWRDDGDGQRIYIGTSAQYWQDVAPELVSPCNGALALDSPTLGVAMGICNAREIERLRQTVSAQAEEIAALKMQLKTN